MSNSPRFHLAQGVHIGQEVDDVIEVGPHYLTGGRVELKRAGLAPAATSASCCSCAPRSSCAAAGRCSCSSCPSRCRCWTCCAGARASRCRAEKSSKMKGSSENCRLSRDTFQQAVVPSQHLQLYHPLPLPRHRLPPCPDPNRGRGCWLRRRLRRQRRSVRRRRGGRG